MSNQNIIGLNIDDSIIKNAVMQTTKAAILESMSNNGLAEQIVHEVLNIKVDRQGNIATNRYDRENGITWLEYTVRKAIQEEVHTALKEAVEENRPAIRDAIKRELEKDDTRDGLVNEFMKSVINTLACSWCPTVNVEFKKER